VQTRAQIVAGFEERGFAFRSFELVEESPHALGDWDWNQRDLPHIPHIHGGFRFFVTRVDEESAAGFYLQRVLGVPVPLGVRFENDARGGRVYQTALGPFALVIEASLAPAAAGTRVRTAYSLGAARGFRWILPWAERLLRRNHERLHDEDEPMRRRRSQLRAWGYRFAVDETGAGYRRSLDLSRANVIPPPSRAVERELALDDGGHSAGDGGASKSIGTAGQSGGGDAEWRVGRDDHLGLRVTRDGRCLRVFERMCRHEGASLDACPVEKGRLVCPWHGRRIAPVATLELDGAPREASTPHHRLALDGTRLRIGPRDR
jgi:Rieske [2Fe-2S] domain